MGRWGDAAMGKWMARRRHTPIRQHPNAPLQLFPQFAYHSRNKSRTAAPMLRAVGR